MLAVEFYPAAVSFFSCDKHDLFLSKTVSSLMIQIMATVPTIRRTRNVNQKAR